MAIVDTGAPDEMDDEGREFVRYELIKSTAIITLNRPEYGNAQNYRMLDHLDGCFIRAANDDAVAAIILRGAGKHFSSGHDIGSPGRDKHLPRKRSSLWYDHLTATGAEKQYALEQDAFLHYCRRWQEIPKPTIAMVQGACIAGGLMLAWICDVIVAAENAYFQDPVVRMGIPGVEYFAHAFELPPRIAKEFLLFGQRMSAERAYHFGMVNRVVPLDQLEAEAMALAREVADRPRFAVAMTKQAINLVEDLRGKRLAMDGVFQMHHLAHAHNSMVSGSHIGNHDAASMAATNHDE